MGVTVARISQIEHGEVTSFEVIAATSRPSAADWTRSPISDRTIRLPVSDSATAA
jgi:hypothetical protein